MRTLTTSALIITSTLLFTACSTTPTNDTAASASDSAKSTAPAAAQPVASAAATPTAAKPAPAPLNFIPIKRSVFFDYNKYDLKPEYSEVVADHAKYLIANSDKKATLQGNADERGGSEYNLALGQKRAEAERKALELLGVPTSQLEAISFGKEKPRTLGHNEAAWADNRRSDIVYHSK
jgi:peptidoglycan-associated lipoprotein